MMKIYGRYTWLGLLFVLAFSNAQAQEVLVYDANTDDHVAQTACTNLGYTCTVANETDFDTLLNGAAWDLVIMDLPSTDPDGPWQTSLTTYIDGGGLAIQTGWSSSHFSTLAAVFEVSIAGSHDAVQFYQWDGHSLFSSPNPVPANVTVVDDSWGTNGFFFTIDALGSAVAAAGFTASPTADQAASVIGNGGRTIFNGFLFDDFYPADTDASGKDDIVEYVENQMASLLGGAIGGAPTPQTGPVVPVPAIGPIGLLLMTLMLGLMAYFRIQRKS